MKKCEVIAAAATIVVGKGSIVYVSEKQYELARYALKPVEEKAEKPEKVEAVEAPVEEEKVIKEKKSRKKAE